MGAGPRPGGPPGASRFGAVRVRSECGRSFASRGEYARWLQLKHLEALGEITGLECQPLWHFPIGGRDLLIPWGRGGERRRARYTADFRYVDSTGVTIVEDVKGVMTPDAALRIALMEHVHGVRVRLVKPPRLPKAAAPAQD